MLVGVYYPELNVPLTPGERCTAVKVARLERLCTFCLELAVVPVIFLTLLSLLPISAY